MSLNKLSDWIDNSTENLAKKILTEITNEGLLKYFILACMCVCIGASIINIVLDLPIVMLITTLFLSVYYLIVFLIWKRGNSENLCKVLLVVSLLAAMNFVWITNGGSYGPVIIIFQSFLPIFLFLFRIKYRFIIVFISLLNICILFLLEYFHPELINKYDNDQSRLLDVFFIFIIFLLIEIPILYIAQQYLINKSKQAQKSDKIKSAFLANISHEVRTPMNAIIGFSELLNDDSLDSNTKKIFIDLIKENGTNLLQIINNVMDASKLETNSVEVNKKPFKILDTFNRLKLKYAAVLPKGKNLKLDFKISNVDDNFIMYSDENIIFQILSKLINNALKYTREGFIEFGMIHHNDTIKLYVSDSGEGISENAKIKIFDRFFLEGTKYNGKNDGVGLGLAISNELTIKLGGKMELTSAPGKGSTFYVILNNELSAT